MKKILIIAAVLLVTVVACRKDKNSEGPSIAEIYGPFKVMTAFAASTDTVDFEAGQKVIFSATFNKVVNWEITVTGSTSKAKKIITGQSRQINSTNALWNGSTTLFPMFKQENCVAKLKIENETDSFVLPIRIAKVKIDQGFVIADFETGLKTSWTRFIQSGANMDFKVKTDALAPQAGAYLNMAGTVDWDYLIGLVDFPASAYGTAKTFPLSSNPDNVYMNCLIYGDASVANTSLVLFQLKEDENADGVINANSDDEYDYEIKVDWSGWKLISIKYSDIVTLVNGQPATPKGNRQHNPDKLGKISMLHLANPNNGFASTKIDYIVFTNDKPLQP